MLQRLSHWLIPTKRNQHHPHILRPIGLLVVVLVVAFIPSIYNYSEKGTMQVLGYATAISVGELYDLSNAQRVNNGIAPLSLNGQLNQAALAKAQHMFVNDYWAHNAPDGTTPWSFISKAGFSYSIAGENLAKNFSTSAGVVNGWMNSPSHRDNLLKSGYDSVGYAAVNGTLQGEELTLVVAMYAKAYVAAAPAPAPAPAPIVTQRSVTPRTAEPAPTPAPASPAPTETPVEAAPIETPAETSADTPVAEVAIPVAPQTTTEKVPVITASTPVTPAAVAGAMVTAPVKAYTGLNWGQKTSLFILSILLLLFIMKHTLVWRAKRRGVKQIWLRSHPLAQASFIGVALIITLASGAGSVL